MASTRLRPVVKVTRQASGKTWAVTLWEPRLDRRTVLGDSFESRKLADQFAKAYRAGTVRP